MYYIFPPTCFRECFLNVRFSYRLKMGAGGLNSRIDLIIISNFYSLFMLKNNNKLEIYSRCLQWIIEFTWVFLSCYLIGLHFCLVIINYIIMIWHVT